MQLFNDHNLYHVAEVELTYKNKQDHGGRIKINDPNDSYNVFYHAWDHNRIDLVEQFKILLLKSNSCLGIAEIATGGTASCPVDPKMVFSTALKANAASIILAHNHPSGNLKPSKEDIAITRKLCEGGRLLDITILDHLIITSHGYTSLLDKGLMPV